MEGKHIKHVWFLCYGAIILPTVSPLSSGVDPSCVESTFAATSELGSFGASHLLSQSSLYIDFVKMVLLGSVTGYVRLYLQPHEHVVLLFI